MKCSGRFGAIFGAVVLLDQIISEARYFGGRIEEHSLMPLGEARLDRTGLDEWLRRSQTEA